MNCRNDIFVMSSNLLGQFQWSLNDQCHHRANKNMHKKQNMQKNYKYIKKHTPSSCPKQCGNFFRKNRTTFCCYTKSLLSLLILIFREFVYSELFSTILMLCSLNILFYVEYFASTNANISHHMIVDAIFHQSDSNEIVTF